MFRKTELIFLSPENWNLNFKSGKLDSYFWVQKIWKALHGTLGKKFSKTSPQSLFKTSLDTFGNDSGQFLNFETFRRLDPPGNTGQKKFSINLPQNMFKTRLHNFGNDFGHLWNFESFRFFLKNFQDSKLHGTVGKNFLSKRKPQNTFGHLGTILDISRNLKLFWFFSWFFSKYLPQNISPENWIQNF